MTTTDCRPLPSPRALLITLVLALMFAFALGVVARGPNVLGIDRALTDAVQRMQGGIAPVLADIGNLLGSTTWAAVAIAACLIVAVVMRVWPELAYLATLLVLRLVGTQLKPIFDSPRPTEDLAIIVGEFDGTGYPSGHALTASTMALGLAVIAWRRIPSRGVAIATVVLLVVLALVVGWARVWSGAHWATDVIGGYAFGVAIVVASTLVLLWMSRRVT